MSVTSLARNEIILQVIPAYTIQTSNLISRATVIHCHLNAHIMLLIACNYPKIIQLDNFTPNAIKQDWCDWLLYTAFPATEGISTVENTQNLTPYNKNFCYFSKYNAKVTFMLYSTEAFTGRERIGKNYKSFKADRRPRRTKQRGIASYCCTLASMLLKCGFTTSADRGFIW